MKILDGVATLADRYDGFILDLWGVVHDGRKPYPGVADALGRLKARGKRIAFLSNAPRRAHVVEALLTGMGLDRALWDATITSGELAWRHLRDAQDLGRHALHIGPERDLSTVEGLDFVLQSDPIGAQWVLNTGPDPERGNEDAEAYRPLLEACAARRLPMLCVNPDRYVMIGIAGVICAVRWPISMSRSAARARRRSASPTRPPIPRCWRRWASPTPAGCWPSATARTPISAGAQAAGLDAVWALTGLAAHAHGAAPSGEQLARVAADEGVTPIAALTALRW